MRTTPSTVLCIACVALSMVTVCCRAGAGGGTTPPPPLIRENATIKLTDHVWAIPDFNVGLVPNVGIIVGSKATLVVDTGTRSAKR